MRCAGRRMLEVTAMWQLSGMLILSDERQVPTNALMTWKERLCNYICQ